MTAKRKIKVDTLTHEILGKLDAHVELVNIEVLVSVVRKYLFEITPYSERQESIDKFCNMLKSSGG